VHDGPHRIRQGTEGNGRAGAPGAVDLRLLPSFAVLAEELHFGRAAERLSLAQPALSQQVRRLEAQVGRCLFERDRRHVELSEAGKALLEPARRALALIEAGLEAATDAAGRTGVLRVGLSLAARARVAPELERQVLLVGADLRLEWQEGSTDRLLTDLVDGRLDAALTFCATCPAELDAVQLLAPRAAVALHAHDPLASRETLDGPELAGYRVVVPPHGGMAPGYLTMLQHIWRTWTGTPPSIQEARTTLYSAIPSPGMAGVVPERCTAAHEPTTVVVAVAGGQLLPFDLHVRADDDRPAIRQLLRCAHAVAEAARPFTAPPADIASSTGVEAVAAA